MVLKTAAAHDQHHVATFCQSLQQQRRFRCRHEFADFFLQMQSQSLLHTAPSHTMPWVEFLPAGAPAAPPAPSRRKAPALVNVSC
jgi:hypothetical protein